MEDVFAGTCRKIPEKPDALYALTAAMPAYARSRKDDLTAIGHSIRYGLNLPPEFSLMLLRDYMLIEEGYREKLLTIPSFLDWLQRNERLL
jgi:hypothetical protein